MSKPKSKVLRVGLVRDGRVVKECTYTTCESVTIGTGDRCTFQLNIDGLPEVYPLIRYHNKRYTLQFTPSCLPTHHSCHEFLNAFTARSPRSKS